VDFKTIAPIRFGFASEPADQARRIASYSLKRNRRRMAMLAEARDVLPHLPGPGESLHALQTGRYDLMHLIVVIVEMRPVPVNRMRLATLSYNGRNLAEMLRLLDSGKVTQLSLLCSTYFARHGDRDLYEETLQELRRRGQQVAAPRSHAKVVTMEFADGEKLVLEGSANLRTNSNWEPFCLIHDAGLHDWHSAWFDELLASHESDQSRNCATG
jgi:hypothetical protein